MMTNPVAQTVPGLGVGRGDDDTARRADRARALMHRLDKNLFDLWIDIHGARFEAPEGQIDFKGRAVRLNRPSMLSMVVSQVQRLRCNFLFARIAEQLAHQPGRMLCGLIDLDEMAIAGIVSAQQAQVKLGAAMTTVTMLLKPRDTVGQAPNHLQPLGFDQPFP